MHSFRRLKFNERIECKICQAHEKEKFSSQKFSFSQVQSTHLQLTRDTRSPSLVTHSFSSTQGRT